MSEDDPPNSDHTEIVTTVPPPDDSQPCPRCLAPNAEGQRFCESCGYDFNSQPSGWAATVAADREYYDRLAPDEVAFPAQTSPRTYALDADEIHIGRRSDSRGIVPEIDLSGPPPDPCVSHEHAKLVRSADGSFAIIDTDSTNGTTINGSTEALRPNEATPLADGDRIHVGAWTTISIKRA